MPIGTWKEKPWAIYGNHEVTIAADHYVEVDDASIPTGQLLSVSGAMDLRQPTMLGTRIGTALPEGYDHCYLLDKSTPLLQGNWGIKQVERLRPRLAARLRVPERGRVMEVYTSYPGMQLYTGKYLNETKARNNSPFLPYSALCLETQFLPDSPNQPDFPDTILRPGQIYEQVTVHRFFTE